MNIIVQKFGGTSVGNLEKIKNVAQIIKKEIDLGNIVVVVVSAMSGETNKLLELCEGISLKRDDGIKAEYDVVAASGEQVTAGLVAMALLELGIKARSYLGWQAGILCDENYTSSRITDINIDKIQKAIEQKIIPVIAGFQGITKDGRYVTLGRGGSDTSAVAIAARLKALRCDIYTDVDGIYTADPRLVTNAKRLDHISYDEMLELSSLGAKVMHTRSIEMALKKDVTVRVLSSFTQGNGTIISKEIIEMEKRLITGIAHTFDEVCITLKNVSEQIELSKIFGLLSKENINVDMIIQIKTPAIDKKDISFSITKKDLDFAIKILNEHKKFINFEDFFYQSGLAKISVVGVGMKYHSGVAADMFKTIEEMGTNIYAVTTSEIKISVLIKEEECKIVAQKLHSTFSLDKELNE
jgi:aspartate kinase